VGYTCICGSGRRSLAHFGLFGNIIPRFLGIKTYLDLPSIAGWMIRDFCQNDFTDLSKGITYIMGTHVSFIFQGCNPYF